MSNLLDLNEIELEQIGEMVLSEININLFNAEPTIHKAYQVYVELKELGYKETNKEVACAQIIQFFKKRSAKHIQKEFYQTFKIPYQADMNRFLTLSFRNSTVAPEVIKEVTTRTFQVLAKLDLQNYGVTKRLLLKAITELYQPRYYESEWRISIAALESKIKKILIYENQAKYVNSVERFFFLIDPNSNKKNVDSRMGPGSKDEKQEIIFENFTETTFNLNHLKYEFKYDKRKTGEMEANFLTNNSILKDSEVEYVKFILVELEADKISEVLSTDLYQNDKRHTVVANFLILVKTYNLIMGNQECDISEALRKMKIIVKAIRDLGRSIILNYEEMVTSKVEELGGQLRS